jgi:hypothetical protein
MNAEEFLRRRKDRSCAIVLTVVDREVTDPHVRERIRKVVLDQINDFYCAMVDVSHSLSSETVVLNELYLQRLDEIYERVVMNGHG